MSLKHYTLTDKKYQIKEVLDYYGSGDRDYDGEKMKMGSQRYMVFKNRGCECVSCGRTGTHFRMQKSKSAKSYHFGLWSDDDIQMTKDHIIPASLGGLNVLENYQTMCEKCNMKKGNSCSKDDIKKGKSAGKVLPNPNKNYSSLAKTSDYQKAKFIRDNLDNDELYRQRQIIKKFSIKTRTNPYESVNNPEEVNKALKYCINHYTKVIDAAKGKISSSDKILIGFPKKISKEIIAIVKEKYENRP